MAAITRYIGGNYDGAVNYIKDQILNHSMSATLEEEQYVEVGGVRTTVIAFERYSFLGDNRVSLTVTITGYDNNIHVIGISTGGSQAVFFKINTLGEDAFLETLADALDNY